MLAHAVVQKHWNTSGDVFAQQELCAILVESVAVNAHP